MRNSGVGGMSFSFPGRGLRGIDADIALAAAPSPGGSETPKSAKGKKRKQVDEIGADADDDEVLTPSASKKGKRSRKSATPAKADEEAVIGTEDDVHGVKAEPED
jgi:hypothetical protein